MWTLLLATLAFADDTDCSAHEECDSPEEPHQKKPMRHDLTGEIYAQGIANGTAIGGGAELVQGAGFFSVKARGESYQHWIGRATIGVDFFPRSRFDLTLGVFAGTIGHVATFEETRWVFDPTIGVEFGIGTSIGPVAIHWQHAGGGGDEHFSEDTARLGYNFSKRFTAFGQVVHFQPGDDPDASGFGVGASLRI